MGIGDMVPWRWGGLSHPETEEARGSVFRREMDALHRNIDRLFEGLWEEGGRSSLLPSFWTSTKMVPSLDMAEDDKTCTVTVELPGMDEKNVEITLSDRTLTIRGKKEEDKEEEGKDFYRRERAYGSFRRTLEIPVDIDAEKIEASFKNGVLTINLPKTAEAQEKVKHITVKAA